MKVDKKKIYNFGSRIIYNGRRIFMGKRYTTSLWVEQRFNHHFKRSVVNTKKCFLFDWKILYRISSHNYKLKSYYTKWLDE